jgi:hypothetical protein
MTREYIVVSFIDDAQFDHFSSELFTDIDSAFKAVQSLKKTHKADDSIYEIRMSFWDTESEAKEYIKELIFHM